MSSFFKRLKTQMSFRYYLTSLLLVLFIGAGFYLLLLIPLKKCINTVINDSMQAVAQNMDLICEHNYGAMLRTKILGDMVAVRVQQSITLDSIEEHARSHQMLVQVFAGSRPLLASDQISWGQAPDPAQRLLEPELLSELEAVGEVRRLTIGENEYYAIRTTFSPWDWQIVVLKESAYYQEALQPIRDAYRVTIALLLLWMVAVVLFFRYQIDKPINELISSLGRGEKPAYRGVYEFEFLSDRLREIMQEQEIMRRRLSQQQRLEAIGVLAGGIAHDFNNLLTALYGQISLAIMALPADHPARRHLRLAEISVGQTRFLTSRLLVFTAGRSGLRSHQRVPVLQLIKERGAFVLNGSDCEFNIEAEEDLWDVEMDQEKMDKVFLNLILNAREAMEPEQGRLDIRCDNLEVGALSGLPLAAGRYVRIKISDNGRGINPEDLDKIFDPYFSTKERSSINGTGLGLTFCYAVIVGHGGHVEVDSAPGRGTTFTLYLPAAKESAAGPGEGQD